MIEDALYAWCPMSGEQSPVYIVWEKCGVVVVIMYRVCYSLLGQRENIYTIDCI
jgi:hypothetical protein